jgi:hypothetical protein
MNEKNKSAPLSKMAFTAVARIGLVDSVLGPVPHGEPNSQWVCRCGKSQLYPSLIQ